MVYEGKSKEIKQFLKAFTPYDAEKGVCATCGRKIRMADFRDASSRKEYGISGMCQVCQDSVFGEE